MKRAIVQPADVTGAALGELKQWLGITRSTEDAQLVSLLLSSLDLCEAFTGQMPLESGCEEQLESSGQWQSLSTRPVRAITSASSIAADGTSVLLGPEAFDIDISADGAGRFRLRSYAAGDPVRVSYIAGIAADWIALPDALKHGIIRLAAHHYLGRDAESSSEPPASVAALWRPWKRFKL